jgi:hypothetical protein
VALVLAADADGFFVDWASSVAGTEILTRPASAMRPIQKVALMLASRIDRCK